jgi:micrococcal nuclease
MKIFNNLKNKLEKCNNDIKLFSLEGELKLCKVVDIYDGDTCKVVFDLNNCLYKWNIRMTGYDSPEIRMSKDDPEREEKKLKGLEARDYLRNLILNKIVYIKCGNFDKYGRLLGTIFINKKDIVSVNELMINHNFGYIYNGGTKN